MIRYVPTFATLVCLQKAKTLAIVALLSLASCSVVRDVPSSQSSIAPSSILDSYNSLATRMDSRIGTLTPGEAHRLWGRPDKSEVDGDYLRVVWFQDRRTPAVLRGDATGKAPTRPLEGEITDGTEWPMTTRLVMWFTPAGKMKAWALELQDGSIYSPQ